VCETPHGLLLPRSSLWLVTSVRAQVPDRQVLACLAGDLWLWEGGGVEKRATDWHRSGLQGDGRRACAVIICSGETLARYDEACWVADNAAQPVLLSSGVAEATADIPLRSSAQIWADNRHRVAIGGPRL
jgi:hypothetical protein